ncbi:MAG TPA: hypothetical protein VK021_05270 [Flavobacteriaceae bacterium]|nr:hypothetical protein [Flavobacteriaceae bacterium]
MPFSKIIEHYEELKKDLSAYIQHKLQYFVLLVLKETSTFVTRLIKITFGIILFCFFLFFVSLGGAFLIGEHLDNISYGFFIVAGVYLFLFIIVLLFGKFIFGTQVLKRLSLKTVKIRRMKF